MEDYAYVAQGLNNWLEYSDNKKDNVWLNALIKQTWARFYNEQGWRLSENSLLKYGQRQKVISDGVLPSASSSIINVTLKTAQKNNDVNLMQKVKEALTVGHSDIASQPFWFASQIQTIVEYQKHH